MKGSEIGCSLQKIEKILDLQQQLHQVKEDKVNQEQRTRLQPARTLQQYKQAMQEADHVRDNESFLTKTIDILLKPTANDSYIPQELLKQHQQIADKLHMSTASFSKYFKHHTRKTFSDYVTELRISHACKLLMVDDQNVSQISFDSGFENLSNFYKHFKRITGIIPKEYRRRFIQARA